MRGWHARHAQVLMSIRCRDNHATVAEEALRRAKFKFPGRQKVIRSNNWCAAARRLAQSPPAPNTWLVVTQRSSTGPLV
jgi:hypothetical protein